MSYAKKIDRVWVDKKYYINYEGLIIRIKSYNYKYCFLTNSTCLVVRRVSVILYDLYLSFQLLKSILTFLKVWKSIYKIISILISTNKKVSSKNRYFPFLSSTKKKVIIILNILSLLLSIFWIPISIFLI